MDGQILIGDVRSVLPTLPDESVQMCVTSPPYFGLRDYGCEGQIGLEATVDAYVAELVAVFRDVRRVLKADGTLFLNIGDSYFGSGMTGGTNSQEGSAKRAGRMFSREPHARGYGSGGTAESGSRGRGSPSGNPDDGRTDAWWRHIAHSDARLVLEQAAGPLTQIQGYMAALSAHAPNGGCLARRQIGQSSGATLGLVQTAIHALAPLLASHRSMPVESCPPLPAGFHLSDMFSACLSSLHSFAACVQQCADTWDVQQETPCCTAGTVSLCAELAHHIRCTAGYCSLVATWLNHPQIQPQYTTSAGLKPKDLIGIPWRVAFALQADGWWLRQEIIWSKVNPMPESVTDRCTKSHEQVFLLAKRERYYFDAAAIAETATCDRMRGPALHADLVSTNGNSGLARRPMSETRNKRSVWEIATQSYSGAHFATFPEALIEPCILAGSRPGDTVLDPFFGSGTTGAVCERMGRNWIGVELNPEYAALAQQRTAQRGMALEIPA